MEPNIFDFCFIERIDIWEAIKQEAIENDIIEEGFIEKEVIINDYLNSTNISTLRNHQKKQYSPKPIRLMIPEKPQVIGIPNKEIEIPIPSKPFLSISNLAKKALSNPFYEEMRKQKIEEKIAEYEEALRSWEQDKESIEKINSEKLEKWEQEKTRIQKLNEENEKNWQLEKQKVIESNKKRENERNNLENEINNQIYELKKFYEQANKEIIEIYVKIVLTVFLVPKILNNFQCLIVYNVSTKMLVIESTFPKISNDLAKRNKKEYDYFICGLAIIIIYLSYKYDYMNHIESIVINGYVNAYDKATGGKIKPCILTICASKNEFNSIDVQHVDSISCFNYLKGVKAPELISFTPIAPLMIIDKSDKRIIVQKNIVCNLNDGFNIAAMDWQDFEHLIRELFEKEFQSNGGEVKVTQASHDGGVDAIAYDPDPIRGGKIIIQAKRYTNTVSVSAVRDLYGTVMNEGATKGILVSTADYGPDAYEFAKGKPLTLLNGANLLHLLEKHGQHAKIDLREAKKILNNKLE